MVGILTFHRAVNYGAILQCYALQHTLDELEICNEVIDYRCIHIEQHYNPKPSVCPIHLRHYLKELIQIPIKKKARTVFNNFLEYNIRKSEPVEKENIGVMTQKYNAVITGSDQVWNLAVTGEDTTYALGFNNKEIKRISYAASVGPKVLKAEYKEKLEPCLKKYDVISVREPGAVESIKSIYHGEIMIDVDPTVLPSFELWNKMAERSQMKNSGFIFVYVMQPSDLLYDIAYDISKKENREIFTISMVENHRKLGKDMRGAGIEDFLWMIQNAEYIITNSFHGIMLSLRFHKNFFWTFQKGSNMSNPRFEMLIDQYGIDERCCRQVDDYRECDELDYSIIDNIMEKQRNFSKRNLEKYILGENNGRKK